jgi:hypothetical protein
MQNQTTISFAGSLQAPMTPLRPTVRIEDSEVRKAGSASGVADAKQAVIDPAADFPDVV